MGEKIAIGETKRIEITLLRIAMKSGDVRIKVVMCVDGLRKVNDWALDFQDALTKIPDLSGE